MLYRIGLKAKHSSFFYVSYALFLTAQQSDSPHLSTEPIFSMVAKRYNTTPECVVEGVRRVIADVWKMHRELLLALSPQPLEHRPKPKEFIAILLPHIERKPGPPERWRISL